MTMRDNAQQVDDLIANSNHISKWVEEQPKEDQASWAQSIFSRLLDNASQPRSSSGNSCVKLCGFVEQASKSHSPNIRLWAFTRDVTLKVFNFYIEWNESDNHRSMRLVLDLVPQLIRRNPDEEASQSVKGTIIDNLVSIITGKSSKFLAKSAIKALDHLLSKSIVTLDDIYSSYVSLQLVAVSISKIEVWKAFFFELFHWMRLHFVCPAAGRFIVVLYRALRRPLDPENPVDLTVEIWHQWLLETLADDSSILESIKNYTFLPLFKADKSEALLFLTRMNNYEAVSASASLDISALLQLAALDTGKKVGLVEEPALGNEKSSDESSIVLDEKVLENVLAHPSHEVRSFALSLVISSPSTTRPYSSAALNLLQKHLATFFADSDAKFRNDVASKVRDMFKRVRGAIFVLKRSIPRAAARDQKGDDKQGASAESKPIIYRANLISLPETQLIECLEYHERFLFWYIGFLCGELTPTASYQRHIASLKAVKSILRMEGEKSKTWETPDDQTLFFDRFDGTWLRALSDLIMDPFDDVRDHSASVMKAIFSDERYTRFYLMSQGGQVNASAELSELLKRADELARQTARADHSDGVARAFQLLYRFSVGEEGRLTVLSTLISSLEAKLSVAEKDLGQAVLEAPVHGDFSSLCYTWQVVSELQFSESELQSVQSLQERIVRCGERVWAAVRDILCDDSPEGHLPQELEEVDGLDTKDVLSFSFRAVHEASNLLRILALSIKQSAHPGKIFPSKDLYEKIGNLSFTQLSTLRHRGAFTTVALTFATCCQLVKHLEPGAEETQELTLLEKWYNGTMDAIFAQVSTTRRSAGIPAMMTGVLSANAASPSFEQVMAKLMETASLEARVSETDGSNLPQVHAYNCLKDIFKSSYLTAAGNKSEKYLMQCLELAANGLRSELWAIRNCGLIFLRSLIDCLFGTHESKSTMEAGWDGKANRIAYHRYTSLPNVLLNLLKSGHEAMAPTSNGSAAAESVFPALDIIRRAGPPEMLREELQIHIAKYLASPVWHVREIAARTLCSCLLHDQWLNNITALARESVHPGDKNIQNQVHGVLLTLKFTVERLQEVMLERLQGDVPKLVQFLGEYWSEIKSLPSPEVAGAYLEVVNLVRALPRPDGAEHIDFEFPSFGKHESALLRAQRVFHDVYMASRSENKIESLRSLLLGKQLGVNSLVVGLQTIPKLWDTSKLAGSDLSGFCNLYLEICLAIGPAEPRVVALENLTEILDHSLRSNNLTDLPSSSLIQIWHSIPLGLMNPALTNAVIRTSGCIMSILRLRGDASPAGIQNWGHMMADAGLDDKDFDTRFVAAESLCSFFSAAGSKWDAEECLPALIALYDSLNDDDDDVREVGTAAVKSILGQLLVPIEAANRLLAWMGEHFVQAPAFRRVVAHRILGGARFPSASEDGEAKLADQLRDAMKFDDSLFAIEEQNLFIDEVRESQRWVGVFEGLAWTPEDEVLKWLTLSVREGLLSTDALSSQEDGPLGYASKPQVFAILSRIVRAAAALIQQHPDANQRELIEKSSKMLENGKGHMSGLLLQPLKGKVLV